MRRLVRVPTSGSYPLGFKAGAIHAGIKKKAASDLAAIVSDRDCSAAGVFTSNAFKAAPVQVDQKILQSSSGRGIKAVIVNSGCANAVTGKQGLADAEEMVKLASTAAGAADPGALVMSTGVIGQLLPQKKIVDGIPKVISGAEAGHAGWLSCAEGIMTTDTFPKLVSQEFSLGAHTYRVAGIAKGAGMIHPNMATLLGCLATDAPVEPGALQAALKDAVDESFNSISVDGDMSTNDTIIALANGAAGGPTVTNDSAEFAVFREAFAAVAGDLARLVVRDGEGATKFVTISVEGARSVPDARKIASTVAQSMLVKAALYGKDANWGRVLCAVGYSGINIDPSKTSVSFVPTDGTPIFPLLVNGEPEAVDEGRASEILELPDIEIQITLGLGNSSAKFWTCDLSHEYVTINGDYRS